MIQFAWRQARAQNATAAAAVAVVAIVAALASHSSSTLRFVLGVAAGALIRRTTPAMLTTLVTFIAVRIAFRTWVRPFLFPHMTRSLALDPATTGYGSQGFLPLMISSPALEPAPPDIPDAWITAVGIVNKDGGALTASDLARACPGIGSGRPGGGGGLGGGHVPVPQAVVTRMHDCVARVGATFHEVVTYQPASRYWPLQWYELALFLAAAVALAGVCAWRVRRLG